MAIANRTFGIEIEAFGISMEKAAQAIENVGHQAHVEGYNHRIRSHWKITTDQSVRDGFEVVSPVLKGEEGIRAVREVAKALVRAGARVDHRCGLHVHVGSNGLDVPSLRNLVERYARFEETIDSMMPHSRRGNNNKYCRSMDVQIFNRSVNSSGDFVHSFQEAVFRRHRDLAPNNPFDLDRARYVKLNVLPIVRQGTVEFRQHSGTVNATKIENWIRFCVNFVEQSKVSSTVRSSRRSSTRSGRQRRNSLEAKFQAVLRAFQASPRSALTDTQICRITGWSTTSVPMYISQMRRRYGIRITKIRNMPKYVVSLPQVEAVLRYFNENNDYSDDWRNQPQERRQQRRNMVSQQQHQQNDSPFRGLSNEVRSFYEERIMELSSR